MHQTKDLKHDHELIMLFSKIINLSEFELNFLVVFIKTLKEMRGDKS
jgi:hypothetical protein